MTRSEFLSASFAALCAPLLGLGLASCATNTVTTGADADQSLTPARAQLRSDLTDCIDLLDYDPLDTTGVPEDALESGELLWRDCAYRAARTYARANPPLRLDYELLIYDDREMTEQIQAGTLTRADRRAKVAARIADIRAQEEQQLEEAGGTEADRRQLMDTVETLRGLAM